MKSSVYAKLTALALAILMLIPAVAGCAGKPRTSLPLVLTPDEEVANHAPTPPTVQTPTRTEDSLYSQIKGENNQFLKPGTYEIPEIPSGSQSYKDWAAEQSPAVKDQIKDADGNFLVPFDRVYPDAFESGRFEYNKEHALLKLEGESAQLSKELRACGFIGLESSISTEQGTWYRATVSGTTTVESAIAAARSLDSVLMADFDYVYRAEAVNYIPDSAENNAIPDKVLQNTQAANQWYLHASSIQRTWRFLEANGSQSGGSSSVVIAVIDTGVDYTHPDLKANMWVNRGEIPDNGIDDDNNGYIDDVYGCNTVGSEYDHSGDPMDDHGHGTHVAGIAAASNNKEGVVGVAYNAKIMAVKAGQATGVFNQSDIAEAILYAYEMGADVINMSFGGSACSISVQDALSTAYTRSTLVASAGNDGESIYKIPTYPAALTYVIGVMSVGANGVRSGFSNFDTIPFDSLEYEVYAPGENILSTLPGGRYGQLSGTSMAAPVVAGAAALLRSYFTDRDMYPSKFIAAQLCAANLRDGEDFGQLDTYAALTQLPKPHVLLHDYYLFDDESIAEGNSGDGVVDAGETIDIGVILRNRWGMSKDTVVTIDAIGELGMANPYVEILTATGYFESVGTYSTKDQLIREDNRVVVGTEEPLTVRIAKNCPNDYRIVLNVTITYRNGLDEEDTTLYSSEDKGETFTIEFWVRKGVVLPSQITEDMALTRDNYYIIPNSTYISEDVTVTVEPGTYIQFWTDDPQDPYADTYIAKLVVAGRFICRGTEEDMIRLFPSEMMGHYRVEIQLRETGYVDLQYTNITNAYVDATHVDRCRFDQLYSGTIWYRWVEGGVVQGGDNAQGGKLQCKTPITNSIFYKLGGSGWNPHGAHQSFNVGPHLDSCVVAESEIAYGYDEGPSGIVTNCVFVGNNAVNHYPEIVPSLFELQYDPVHIRRISYDENTGKTYVEAYFPVIALYLNYGSQALLNHYAGILGGQLLQLETAEEFRFITEKFGVAQYVDLPNGSETWPSGAPISEQIPIIPGNADYPIMVWEQNQYAISYSLKDLSHVSDYIFEIPGNVGCDGETLYERDPQADDGFAWTIELIEQMYANHFKKGTDNYTFHGNAILNNLNDTNVEHWLRLMTSCTYDPDYRIGVGGNYWGTTDPEMIERHIYDFNDNAEYADIVVSDYLTTAPENTFPFVTDAYLLDGDGNRQFTVSNSTYTFVVEFNRDMDTTMPLRVRFGSSEPYGEYEIEGAYVTARRWEGTYTLKTTIENGNQYFNIENARAADDHFFALYDAPGRFMFEIDTTGAQAMIMQGNATETGIRLSWMQDDFDTLAGYNVYRSDAEDGFYQRLNSTVLPSDVKEFFDDTVEPGKVYYYNFTVVQTDLSESLPSGKIIIMSMDTMAPDIYHSPVRTGYTGSSLIVNATITDNLQIRTATLYYRTVGEAAWRSTAMVAHNDRYSGIIPAEVLNTAGLEYYIVANDGISDTFKGSAEAPYTVTVKLAVDQNSLGDVDGNGVIEIKDALMLLQAANDRLNLTEEQFLRADINGDGILSAAEALRILQYVSGKITGIQM